jgi:hypothetical protein
MYQPLSPDETLSQGDLIDGCPVFRLNAIPPYTDLDAAPQRTFTRVVVLTQACDLVQTKTTRVVVAPVHAAADLVAQGILKASLIRDQVRRGLVYGWYFLPAAPVPVDVRESIVNLRELHTVARPILERLLSDGKRVCRIQTPYREHLAQHFAVTYMRIGLPETYETQPE